jgi:peroxiredoxin
MLAPVSSHPSLRRVERFARPWIMWVVAHHLIALAVLLLAGCSSPGRHGDATHARGSESAETPPGVAGDASDGRPAAPEVVLADLEGGTLRLSDHRGKVVLLGFWATWCGPCRREVPRLKALHAEYASRGLDIIGLSVDRDGEEGVRSFVREHGMTWPNAVAGEEVIASFGEIDAIPTTFVIDRGGHIAHRFVGLQSEQKLRAAIEPLL